MNDKIRQLALQAGQGEPFHIPPEFVEKFARMIVRECVGILEPKSRYMGEGPEVLKDKIRQINRHFGVEEKALEALEKTASGNFVLVPDDKLAEMQAEIEKLRSWVEMLVEVPFFDEIDHYRGIPVSILRKAEEK
jgi:hypothetical protein